ncbi:TPA: hypothetical protein ACIIB6_005044, partial [Salmonella enterica subsp. enterica serovar Typhimurium]
TKGCLIANFATVPLILPSLSITNGRNRWIGLIEMLSSRIRSERGESTQVLRMLLTLRRYKTSLS